MAGEDAAQAEGARLMGKRRMKLRKRELSAMNQTEKWLGRALDRARERPVVRHLSRSLDELHEARRLATEFSDVDDWASDLDEEGEPW